MKSAAAVTKKTFTHDMGGASFLGMLAGWGGLKTLEVAAKLIGKRYQDNPYAIPFLLGALGVSVAIGLSPCYLFFDGLTNVKFMGHMLAMMSLCDCSKHTVAACGIDLGITLLKNSWIEYDKYSFKKVPSLLKVMMKYPKITSYFAYNGIAHRDKLANYPHISSLLGFFFMRKWVKQHYQIPSVGFNKITNDIEFMWSGKKA